MLLHGTLALRLWHFAVFGLLSFFYKGTLVFSNLSPPELLLIIAEGLQVVNRPFRLSFSTN